MNGKRDLLPDFLGIGTPRAGTTWLWENLRQHPQIWLPYRKELHYFDRATSYPSPSFLATQQLARRLLGQGKEHAQYRRVLLRSLIRDLRHPSWNRLRWDSIYLLGTINDEWYASLFEQGRGKVKGEITPGYALLEPDDINHVYELMPGAKLIILIRNPIERTWSSVRKRARASTWDLESLSEDAFLKMINSKALVVRADYLKTLSNWRLYFPPQQFFIGFYEEIAQTPRDFLLRLFDFLAVEVSERWITAAAERRYNASLEMDIPLRLKTLLAEQYYDQIKGLAELVGGYATTWLADIEASLPGRSGEAASPTSSTANHKAFAGV